MRNANLVSRLGSSSTLFSIHAVTSIAVFVISGMARADLDPPPERWRSAVDFGFEVELEEREVLARGTITERSSTQEISSPAFRLGYTGHAPPLERVWGAPRPFARAGIKFMYSSADLKNGDYTQGDPEQDLQALIDLPETVNPNRSREAFEAADADDFSNGFVVDFRNSAIPGIFAGFGLAFERVFPSSGIPGWVAFRPAIDYSMRRYALRGRLVQVDEPTPDIFEITRQVDTESFWEHRLGPSVELEVGLRDQKRFAVSLFFAARFLFLLSRDLQTWGNPETISTTLWDFNAGIPESSAGKAVRFRSDASPLLLSIGGGLRFHWFGGP